MEPTLFPNNEKIDFSKKLNVKFGIDPTSDKLHLGHLIPLLVAKKLWQQGHNIHIVLGTFTAQLGDPSGKDTMRPIIDQETTNKNAESITKQIHRIFDNYKEVTGGVVSISKNHTWFEGMNSIEMTRVLSKFTTTQLLSRDSFQKRIEANNPIGMHELIVPVLQGMDSVFLKADVEIGGTDQLFNFAITRDVQREHGQKPEVCMLMSIINGTDGRKMSKSFDNCIFINDIPADVFGKTMSISDELMKEWWAVFMDDEPMNQHPMKAKKDLAWFIAKEIWNTESANEALINFENTIQGDKIPEEIKEISIPADGKLSILDAVMQIRNCSKNEAKRLIGSNAVKFVEESETKTVVSDNIVIVSPGSIIKVGKRDFGKVV